MNACAHRSQRVAGLLVLLVGAAASAGCQQMSTSGHNLTGVRLYQQGQYQQAAERFQQAIVANPKSGDSYYNYASTLHAMAKAKGGDPQLMIEAENYYNKCLDYDRDHVECHRALGVLLAERGEPDRQFALMKNWASSSPMIAAPRVELARLYDEYGDSETAQRHLEEAVHLEPDNARAWSALAAIREKSNDLVQAMHNYQKSLTLNPMQPDVSARVAALQQTLNASNAVASGSKGETRFVSAPTATVR